MRQIVAPSEPSTTGSRGGEHRLKRGAFSDFSYPPVLLLITYFIEIDLSEALRYHGTSSSTLLHA